MQKIVTKLWLEDRVEEALEFYTSLLPDSRVLDIVHYGASGHGPPADIMFANFELAGQVFTIVNGNSFFKPNAAMSLCINCDEQAEIDRLWDRLTAAGGRASIGGWLTDRFGVSWQIAATQLNQMLSSDNEAAVARVSAAFVKMNKLDIAELERAFRGEESQADV